MRIIELMVIIIEVIVLIVDVIVVISEVIVIILDVKVVILEVIVLILEEIIERVYGNCRRGKEINRQSFINSSGRGGGLNRNSPSASSVRAVECS